MQAKQHKRRQANLELSRQQIRDNHSEAAEERCEKDAYFANVQRYMQRIKHIVQECRCHHEA